jgi:hypothetical protein
VSDANGIIYLGSYYSTIKQSLDLTNLINNMQEGTSYGIIKSRCYLTITECCFVKNCANGVGNFLWVYEDYSITLKNCYIQRVFSTSGRVIKTNITYTEECNYMIGLLETKSKCIRTVCKCDDFLLTKLLRLTSLNFTLNN